MKEMKNQEVADLPLQVCDFAIISIAPHISPDESCIYCRNFR